MKRGFLLKSFGFKMTESGFVLGCGCYYYSCYYYTLVIASINKILVSTKV